MPQQIIKRPNGTKRVVTHNNQPSKTDQSFAKDCDINVIWARFKKTNLLHSPFMKGPGQYADFSDVPDLQTAFQRLQDADHAFSSLPSNVRLKFNNNPLEMVSFLQDPKNNDEAYELGLKIRPPSSKPIIDNTHGDDKARLDNVERNQAKRGSPKKQPDKQNDTESDE